MERIKKRFGAGLLVLLCGGLYAFQLLKVVPKTVTLEDAVTQKMVSCKLISNGNYSGESVAVSLTNLTGTPLNVIIPAGTVFRPDDTGDQDLIVVEQQAIALNGKASVNQVLDGFCMEAHDSAPTTDNGMRLAKTDNKHLQDLAAFLDGKGYDAQTVQSAVWAVSDHEPISTIGNGDEKGKALRTFLSQLTSRPDPWYATKVERHITPERRIETNPVSVNGKIRFTSDGSVKIHEVVQKVGGEIKNTSEEIEFPKKGNWNYEFTLTVKGWEKGDYVVNVMEGTKLVKAFPFTI
jgi:hypothetical protein